uniref:small integral membrane protein 11-like n=1 Tax=Myxine glutinosa TaxID=7769 RepID=UPI00358F8E60
MFDWLNFSALDRFPLLFYILAAKSILLCFGFMLVKNYQRRRLERQQEQEKQQQQQQQQQQTSTKKEE